MNSTYGRSVETKRQRTLMSEAGPSNYSTIQSSTEQASDENLIDVPIIIDVSDEEAITKRPLRTPFLAHYETYQTIDNNLVDIQVIDDYDVQPIVEDRSPVVDVSDTNELEHADAINANDVEPIMGDHLNTEAIRQTEHIQHYSPLSSLNADVDHDWHIMVRLLRVVNLRPRGIFMLFIDKDRYLMQGIIYDSTSLNNLATCLHEGNVYCFTGVRVVPLGPGYYIANTKNLQLLFTKDTRILDMMNDSAGIPYKKYTLMKLSNITTEMHGMRQLIDVVCIVVSIGPCQYPKAADPNRDLMVIDKTRTLMRMTLWGHFALHVASHICEDKIILACGLSVNNYQGTVLQTTKFTKFYLYCRSDLCTSVSDWYTRDICAQRLVHWARRSAHKSSNLVLIANAKIITVGEFRFVPNVKHFRILAAIDMLSTDNMFYESCNKCNMEVHVEQGSKMCSRCRATVPCTVRYRIQAEILDATGGLPICLTGVGAEFLLRSTPLLLQNSLKTDDGRQRFDQYINKLLGHFYTFVLHAPPTPRSNERPETAFILKVDWGEACAHAFKRMHKR